MKANDIKQSEAIDIMKMFNQNFTMWDGKKKKGDLRTINAILKPWSCQITYS